METIKSYLFIWMLNYCNIRALQKKILALYTKQTQYDIRILK